MDDVPDRLTLAALVTELDVHRSVLVDAQHGIGQRRPTGELARHALGALALGAAFGGPAPGAAVVRRRRRSHLRGRR